MSPAGADPGARQSLAPGCTPWLRRLPPGGDVSGSHIGSCRGIVRAAAVVLLAAAAPAGAQSEVSALRGAGATASELSITQSITGPIKTQNNGSIETLRISDSIVQALPETLGQPAPPAIKSESGETHLSRTTVLGALSVHRLDASECILDDIAVAEDAQHGCIRFSAYAEGSVVHQPYESVTVAQQAELFRSRDFGHPQYARLRDTADQAIITGGSGASIMAGAEDGSEMGAFYREKIPLKRRGLDQKFAEFMPIGQVPVWIDAT